MIGGWAFNRYATPRVTGDIDFFVSDDPTNELHLREALTRFGFASSLPPETHRLFQKKIIMLGRPPNRIDLLCEISGVAFEEAWSRKVEGNLDGIRTYFISLEDLIRNKSATGRSKDVADLIALKDG